MTLSIKSPNLAHVNTEALKILTKVDPVLKKIISKIELEHHTSTQNVFNDLMSCVIEQQIHYRSTKNIFKRMLDRAGLTEVTLDNFEIFEEKGIPPIKLSARKFETILRLVNFFKQHTIDWQSLSDNEARTILSKIKGIGNWTIDMILLYTLERPNIFPVDDYRLKNMMTQLYSLDVSSKLKAQLLKVSEHWNPYKSLAVRYILEWKKHT